MLYVPLFNGGPLLNSSQGGEKNVQGYIKGIDSECLSFDHRVAMRSLLKVTNVVAKSVAHYRIS